MTTKMTGSALVRAVGRGHPYPSEQRARVVQYAAGRQQKGVALYRIAREVGVASGTLKKWMGNCAFEVVEIEPAATATALCGPTVLGPCGLRIEGLTLENIAELVRRLS